MRMFRVGVAEYKDWGAFVRLLSSFAFPPFTTTIPLNMSSSYQEVPIASIGPLTATNCESPPVSSVVGGLSC